MFKFLRSKRGQGMVEYGLIICAVAIAAIIGLNSLGQNNADRTMEIAETLEDANASYEAEQKDLANKESIGNFNSGNGGYYSGSGGGGLGSFPSYSGGVNWRPTTKEDGTVDTNDRIGTIDEEATEDAPVLNDDAPEGNQAPIASFYVSNQNNIRVGQSLTFYNTSTDPDGDQIVKEEWQGIPTGNKFTLEGSYEVKLRVVDEWGNWSQWTKVTLEVKNSKPIAIITSSPDFDNGDEFDKTQIFQWSSTASYDPDNHRIVDEEWRGKNNYYEAGEHTVELRVQDEFGTWSNWVSKTFTIYNGSKPVIVSGTLSDAKNNTWSTDLLMQGQDEIPELLSGKDIYFKAELTITDEDRDTIKAIQYRVDGTTINALYNTQNRGNDEEKQVTSANSPNVPIDNTLSPGTHSIEVRVQDYNGAWSTWTAPIYIRVIDAKAEDPENPDEEVQYMTMDIFNFNTSSNSAFGGNRGPWYAGNFIILPTDQTGATIKDAVVMVDDVEIESTFETIAGVPAVKFNYTEIGSHTIKAKFQDENDVWSDWVENDSFNIIELNMDFNLWRDFEECTSSNCYYHTVNFDVVNTGVENEYTFDAIPYPMYGEFYYVHPLNVKLAHVNVKINDVITTIPKSNFWFYSGESGWGEYSFPTINIAPGSPVSISFQAVDENGSASAWTNTAILQLSIDETAELPEEASLEVLSIPAITEFVGWTNIFKGYDDNYGTISLPSDKRITFGGVTYSNLFVNSNGQVKFDTGSGSITKNPSDTNSTNSIVLFNSGDIKSDAYYKYTDTGIDILFTYEDLGTYNSSYTPTKYAIAKINFDGTGSLYYPTEPSSRVSNATAFVKTVTGNYSQITSAVQTNKAYNWVENTSGTTPYYILSAASSIPSEYANIQTQSVLPVYLNGSKITSQLIIESSEELPPYEVYEIQGNIIFKNTTTNEEFTGTFTGNNGWSTTNKKYMITVSDIPGLTIGEYEISIEEPTIKNTPEIAYMNAPIPNNIEPITTTLLLEEMNILDITYSTSAKNDTITIRSNNTGSVKNAIELQVDGINFTQVATQAESENTENSFYYDSTNTGNYMYAYIYNSEVFTPGSEHTIKARFHTPGSDIWSNWFEKTITVPGLSVSSVSVTSAANRNVSTLTVNLSNYTNKYSTGARIEVDGTLIEGTNLTTTTLNSGFISKFTKEIPLLTVGEHAIKVTVLYKTEEDSPNVYETDYTLTYTQGDYSPVITGLNRSSGNSTYQQFKVTYRNTYNVGMYTHRQQVFVNDVNVSEYVTNGSTSFTYAYMNIPNEYFTSGSNTIKVKTFYRTANNLFLEYNETNEYTYTYSFSSTSFNSLSVNTSSTTIEDLYLSASFTNPLYKPISNIVIKVNGEIVESEITSSSSTSATIKIDTPTPTAETTSFAITAIATIGGTEYEQSTTYSLKVPSNSPRTSLTHENVTTTSQEYIWFYVYTDVKNEITAENLTLQDNGSDMLIDYISTSWSSSSYSTTNGTMKYRGKVYVYLDDFYYRPGTHNFTASLNYGGTELNYTNTYTYGSIGSISNYIYADSKTPDKLSLYLYYNSSYYYRVKELKVKEYTDSTYTTLIKETTTPLKNGSGLYYYVGSTSREFEPIDITNPNDPHYYKLSFITPWGLESSEISYVYQPVEQPYPSLTIAYHTNGMFKTNFSTNIFNVTKDSLISNLELKVGDNIYPYTKKTTTLQNRGSTSIRSYLNIVWQDTTNNNLISPTYDEHNLHYSEYDRYLPQILQYRIKYSDNTYTDWFDINANFYYPEIYEITAIETNDKITDSLYVTTITVEGTELYSTETFNANVFLDGIEQEVVKVECFDEYYCDIDIVQPENGVYDEMTVSLDYSAYDTTLTTKTITKEDIVIYRDEEELINNIEVTRTPSTNIPTYTLSNFTKLSTELSADPIKINLSTPISFYSETINTLTVNRNIIGLGDFESLPNLVVLRNDTEAQIKNNKTRLDDLTIAFMPYIFNVKTDTAFANSGIYFKEDATKATILYKDVYLYYFFHDTETNLPVQNTPHFDIYIEIDKANGTGRVYFGDMNKENNATIQAYLEGTSDNLTSTKNSNATHERTFFVKHTDSSYGYLESYNTDVNIDTMYSNAMFSWNGGEIHVAPPIINSATIEKVIDEDNPVIISEVVDFTYTGSPQEYTLPIGTHKLEVWGAEGGRGSDSGSGTPSPAGTAGKGGYSTGEITVSTPTPIYVYVGGKGGDAETNGGGTAGWNGGGLGAKGSISRTGGGGGATDIRIGTDSLYSRVIVAGGGGATGWKSSLIGGSGGGTNGTNASSGGTGGTQTSGGTGAANGGFGYGANGISSSSENAGPAGGGGWYGGGAGNTASSGSNYAGGGGSGYVYTSSTASNYPSGSLLSSSHYLANATTIDGTNSFVSPTGGTETGHTGNGFARLTVEGYTAEQAQVSINFTTRSNTSVVRSAKILTNAGVPLVETFTQTSENTIVFDAFNVGSDVDYIYAWIELDDGLYSNNKKINLNKVNISNIVINNDNPTSTDFVFNIANTQNANIQNINFTIINPITNEPLTIDIQEQTITNTTVSIKTNKLPQNEYMIIAHVEYNDYGITSISREFSKMFSTYMSDLNNSSSEGITPKMEPIEYPADLSTSTSGYTTLYSNVDDSYSTISAASGKKFKFGNKEYSQIYINSNGSIRFDTGTSARGSNLYYTSSNTNNSIVLLGGYDLKSYVYYKRTDEGVEVLYKYTQYGNSSFNYWMKALIRYNGTGEIYFIGTPNSNLISNATTFIKIDSTHYDLEIANGSGTVDKYTNKAYKYYFGASKEDIPTITNLSVDQSILNGGRTATLTITTDKPITAADIYVGSSSLVSTKELTQISDYVYTTEISVPNNNATSTIPIKVSAYYLNAQSYWKEINVPYSKSPAPTITNVTGINTTFKEGTKTNVSITYNTSTLNNPVVDVVAKYVSGNEEIDLTIENKEILSSTINITNLDFSSLSHGTGNIVFNIKDNTDIYSDDYIIPVTIIQNEAPIITNVSIPLEADGKLHYKKKLTFTIDYEDVENNELTYVYYRTKTSTGSWSSTTNIALPNDAVEIVDENTIKVTINGYSNSDLTLDYEFSIKDIFYKSEPVVKTYNVTQNIVPEITELVSQTETAVGSTIELSALYTDYEEEYAPSTIQNIYVYVDGELTDLYQNAYASNDTIKVRNLLLTTPGEHTIGLMAKDTYGKMTNKKEITVNVIPSAAPVLFSYDIDTVVLDKDITLKNIFYENSERGNGIDAIEYSIDGNTPVVIEFENTITDNNFSYTLPDTAYSDPDAESKYIFVRIKDTTGTWSTSLMGTFTVGFTNENNTVNNLWIDYYDYMYSSTFGDYSPAFDINDTVFIEYLWGRYSDDMEIIPLIDGVETPDILDDYYKPNNNYIEYLNLSFDNISEGKHKIELLLRNDETSYVYNLGTYNFVDLSQIDIAFVPNTERITGSTNTDLTLSGYLLIKDYYYIEMIDYESSAILDEIINIPGVNVEDYSITRTSFYRDYYMAFYVSYKLRFTEPVLNNSLQITHKLLDNSDLSGTNNADKEILTTSSTINIPIEIVENTSDLTSNWTVTFKSFANKQKTIPNAILVGDLQFAVNYKVTNPHASIEEIKLYVDGEEYPMTAPGLTESVSGTNKTGVISADFTYETLGNHIFELVAITNTNEELRYSIEKNIVHKANPSFEIINGAGTVVAENSTTKLIEGNEILTFRFTDDTGTIYKKQQIAVNNVLYDFPGEKTIDFSKLNQGYYEIKIVLESDYETITKTYYALDPGVTKIYNEIYSEPVRVTIPNSIFLFGNSYNALNISATGIISPTNQYFSYNLEEVTNIQNYNQLILPVQSFDYWYYDAGYIDKVFYKNNIDNLTLYINAHDSNGNRIFYSVAFYNRDILKFNYYIVENSLAEKQLAGVSYDSENFVVTNTSETGLKDNTTVTIDTYRMLAN